MKYNVDKYLKANPVFNYRSRRALRDPVRGAYGFGDPNYNASNSEFGIYAQDNWIVNDHLTLNLGLRWDYETHMLDQDFVTPASAVTAARPESSPPITSRPAIRATRTREHPAASRLLL